MIIAGREKIAGFQKQHPASAAPLNRWIVITEAARWKTTADVRATFGSADFVAGKVVFDIGGNKFRLIAVISFEVTIVFVQAVLTHQQYGEGKWK